MEGAACPLCASGRTEARYRIEIPTLGERKVGGCLACGFHFVSPRPTETELKTFYSAEYFREGESSHGYADYLRKSHARSGEGYLFGRRLRRWKPRGRLLELGCGTGEFLARAAESSGWGAAGVDLSDDAIEVARSSLAESGIELFGGSLIAASFPGSEFDAVVARDVVEHLPAPAATLTEIHRLLCPGGRLWMQVPNARTELAPFHRANRRDELGWEGQAHLNYFDPAGFRDWLASRGWVVERAYTLGLKRALFCLGYLPGVLKTSRWRRPRESPSGGAGRPHKASKWKSSTGYAHLRSWLKQSLQLPLFLPLGVELHFRLRKTVEN